LTPESFKELAGRVCAEDLHRVAGTHLNTDNEHVHVALRKDYPGGKTTQIERPEHFPKFALAYREGEERTLVAGSISKRFALGFEQVRDRDRSITIRDRSRGRADPLS
jgi:hypothetical protein